MSSNYLVNKVGQVVDFCIIKSAQKSKSDLVVISLHISVNFISQNSFQIIQVVAGYEKSSSQPISSIFDTLSQKLVYVMALLYVLHGQVGLFLSLFSTISVQKNQTLNFFLIFLTFPNSLSLK